MRRLRQETWFYIAAAFLALTLSAVWSQDVELAPEDQPSEARTDRGTVIRRRQDLDPSVTEIQNGPVHRSAGSRSAAILPKRLENGPLLLPAPDASVSNAIATESTSRDISLDIERAGYRDQGKQGEKQAVWFRGSIELAP